MASDPFRQGAALAAMLNQEKSSALGFTGERLERELAEVRTLKARLGELSESNLKIARKLLADAEHEVARQLWNLIVQREAMGLFRHDDVYETYGIPRSVVPVPV